MGDESGFEDILSQIVERFIRENGPHTSGEVTECLFDDMEAYVVLSGSTFQIPEAEIDALLNYSPLFAEDDTGRYHIASG